MLIRYWPSYLRSLIIEVCSKHSCSRGTDWEGEQNSHGASHSNFEPWINGEFWLAQSMDDRSIWEIHTAANCKSEYVSRTQDAMRVAAMIDDAENMASSITQIQWEGSCFSHKFFHIFLHLLSVSILWQSYRRTPHFGLISCDFLNRIEEESETTWKRDRSETCVV